MDFLLLSLFASFATCLGLEGTAGTEELTNIYSFVIDDIEGKRTSLTHYKDMVTLYVNVASECGFTDRHYRGLVKLKDVLGHTEKFEILAFPSNQFGQQEPGSNADILNFAISNYNVNFKLFSKVDVIGESAHPLWKKIGSISGNPPNWNFWKYLVGPGGKILNSWGPWSDVDEIYDSVKEAVDSLLDRDPGIIRGPLRPSEKGSRTNEGITGPPAGAGAGPRPYQSKVGPPSPHDHTEL